MLGGYAIYNHRFGVFDFTSQQALSCYCYVNCVNFINSIATTSFDALSNLSVFIFRISESSKKVFSRCNYLVRI